MPKLFPIALEVEELAVGKVMRQLHNMQGVAKVALDLGEPTNKKTNGVAEPRKKHAMKATDFITQLISKNDMPTSELRVAFEENGRRPGSTSSALNELYKNGLIKKAADSKSWTLTKKMKDRLRHRSK